jgi:cystathionine beta-lyase
MPEHWTGQWRSLDFRIELRAPEQGGGPTLRVGTPAAKLAELAGTAREEINTSTPVDSNTSALEWLRFDCFDVNPHWHIDPQGRDEIHPLSETGDPITETFEILAHDLSRLLEQAGAPHELVSDISSNSASSVEPAKENTPLPSFLREAQSAMRHRPVDLDELDLPELQNRRSAKWAFHPRDILPAWVAEMDYPLAAPIQSELRRFTESGDAGYPLADEDTGLPEVFRERMNDRFGWNPDPARVELLSEVVQGMYIALEAFTEPGDGAIVQTPIYPPFLSLVADTERRMVENPLVSNGTRLEFDLDSLAERIDSGTRILLLCNPHNPSGRVMERPELERLGALVLEHDLIIVSDEIHADLLFDGRQHIPIAALGSEIAARTVTLTSSSKAFNIPGLRCAIAHFGSEDLHRRFNERYPPHIRGGIGLFGVYASIAAWRWGQPWLDDVVRHLQGNRDFAKQALTERIPEIGFLTPESTYLAWLDCGALGIEGSPAGHFLRNGKLALSGGRRFGAAWQDHVRLNFATSRPILTDMIDRMAKAVGR